MSTGPGWRRSSYSNKTNCVEASATWRKSSHSSLSGHCVEVATPGRVLVRDSKLGDFSPVLAFTRAEWAAFTAAVRQPAGHAPVPAGSALGHALRRLAAEQASPDSVDPIAGHDSYV